MANPLKLLMKEALKSKGVYGAKRVERAADEIKNLDKMYSEEALRQAFLANPSGELRSGLMTMRPADFERYAAPLNRPFSRDTVENVEKLTKLRKGFDDVPFLELEPASYKGANVGISGHEGRHRSVALDRRGEQSSLVRAFPDRMLIDRKRGMTDEELIDQMRQKLGEQRLVVPQTHRNIERDVVELPDVYKGGGAVRKAGGGIMEAIEAAKMAGKPRSRPIAGPRQRVDIERMRREVEENARRVAEVRKELAPTETKYSPSLKFLPKGTPESIRYAFEKAAKDAGPSMQVAQVDGKPVGVTSEPGGFGEALSSAGALMDIPSIAAGEETFTRTGSPALAAAAYTLTDPIGAVLGAPAAGRAAIKGAKALAPKLGETAEQYMFRTGMALPLDVWHGSPHRFPPSPKNPLGQFDPTKIGTGEGAQAYGHGHYLAEAPKVAKNYVPRDPAYEDKLMRMYKQAEQKRDYESLAVLEDALIHRTPEELRELHPEHGALIDKIASIPQKGSLYKVDLPDEQIAKMLDYDKPINEHSDELKALLEKAGINSEASAKAGSMIKGQEEYLAKHGIPGIYYLDDASRDAGEGTRNFVVFPGGEDMLTIKERMKEGGKVKKPLSMDAMRLAVGGGVKKGVTRTIEEARRLHEAAQKTRSKAAQIEAGLYHPIGGGVKLSKPTELMTASVVDDPSIKQVPRKIVTLEDLQGGVAIPLVGDRAAAGRILEEVEGKRLRTPVKLQGGPGFMQTHTFEGQPEKSAAWASGKGVVTALGNQARRAAELAGTDKVIAPYVAMSPEGVDYNTMLSRAILGQLDIGSLSKRAIQSFNKEVRKVEPRFVGIESPQLEAQLFGGAKEAGNVRKAFVNRMGLEEFRQRGFPDVAATRKAITEPELLHRDLGATGYNIARLDPEGRIVDDPLIPHETYPVQLRGEYMGSLEEEVPYRDFFHGFTDKRRAFGTPEGSDWRAFSMSAPIQQLDQEWLDRVMKSMGKDKPREWKRGGQVKRMAEGGQITSDDLVIEERKL